MSLFSGVLNVFRLQGDDYDDDYDYDEDGYEEDYDDDEDRSSARKKLFTGNKKPKDAEFDDDYSSDRATEKVKPASKKIVPIKTNSTRGLEVVVIKPTTIDDANEITDTLLSGKAVVLNLEGINVEIAQRIIDYSAGSCYSMRGNFKKITNYIFLVTPPSVDISGDIPELVAGGIDLTSFSKDDIKF